MRPFLVVCLLIAPLFSFGQDPPGDNSRVARECEGLIHLLPMLTYSGVPGNLNHSDELIVLINHGFVVGFSPEMNQPRWAAYPMARVRGDHDYDRSQNFYEDIRLPMENRIGTESFGNGYDRGHMVPSSAISSQYGRLSQMETFMMSNMCPQKGGLNRGMWMDFEAQIREVYAQNPTAHGENAQNIWVIIGPVFSDNPEVIERANGTKVAIPESFFAIVVDPYRYPYDRPGNAHFLALIFDQDVSQSDKYSDSMITTIDRIEYLTDLNFFPEFTDYYENKIESAKAATIWP